MARLPRPQAPPAPRPPARRAVPWRPDLTGAPGPVYRALVEAMERDVAAGRLGLGARLPSQRELARTLGVNLTTVTRAIREAQRRGLVAGAPGSGTYVASRLGSGPKWSAGPRAEPGDFADLSLNYPPDAAEAELAGALASWVTRLGRRPGECRSLLPYRDVLGAPADRAAAAQWLARQGLGADPGRILIANGAQHGLGLCLSALARPGDAVLCEALAYPGLRAVAATAGLRLVPVATDREGLRPEALREALRRHPARALVCTLTLQNPTGAVASADRRRALANILRRAGLWVIEDDLYAALAEGAPRPLASLLPDRTIYLTSLSKTVAPGLRVGYLLAPDPDTLEALAGALRASVWMAAPILAAIATAWIREGIAEAAVRRVRAELARRHRAVRRAKLPVIAGAIDAAGAGAPHLWLPVADATGEGRLVARLAERGVGVTGGEAFRVAPSGAAGIRVCLGAASSVEALVPALRIVEEELGRGDRGGGQPVL